MKESAGSTLSGPKGVITNDVELKNSPGSLIILILIFSSIIVIGVISLVLYYNLIFKIGFITIFTKIINIISILKIIETIIRILIKGEILSTLHLWPVMVTEKASHSESLATRSSSFLNWKSFWSQITIISNVSEILIKHSTIKGNCGSCYCPLFLRVLCSIFLFCLFLCLGAKERLMCMSQWDIVSLVFVFLFACCVFPSNALRNVRMVFLQLQSRCWVHLPRNSCTLAQPGRAHGDGCCWCTVVIGRQNSIG